ncbi:hypothetical protein REPUB_Repub03eG0154200 [Reevesia pubescens]
MGSDRKEKKRKKRSNYSSSASEDEGREKSQRRGVGERKSRKKNDKNEKKKDKKSHKEKKSKEKPKSKHHEGDHHSKHGFREISNDDYFSKNNEFATWLKEEKHVFFSELSSESAREFFSEFVKDWNNKKLRSQYYEGIASGPRTAHNWKIKQ